MSRFKRFLKQLGKDRKELGRGDMFYKYLPIFILVFFYMYILGVFTAPIFAYLGWNTLADINYYIFRIFCHQRVERSLFLFGEADGFEFWSLRELKIFGTIPEFNPDVPEAYSETLFGYGHNGDEIAGHKTCVCARCMSIYTFVSIVGTWYMIKNWSSKAAELRYISIPFLLLLMVPMAVDGVAQYVSEFTTLLDLPQSYIDNIPKRIITGGLFGIGFGLLIFQLILKHSKNIIEDND